MGEFKFSGVRRGSANSNSKFTDDQVRSIRQEYEMLEAYRVNNRKALIKWRREMARHHNCSEFSIKQLVEYNSYNHVK